jgi:hypothetical protein
MKMLFWSALIIAAIWWLMKKNLGVKNDLTAHLNEQEALQSIGNSALGANQVGQGNWPLATIGMTALAGARIDPFNPDSPFSINNPATPDFFAATPSSPQQNPFGFILN